jgi:hypothetical protein
LGKVRRLAEDIFVGCEETLCGPDCYRDDGGVEWAGKVSEDHSDWMKALTER